MRFGVGGREKKAEGRPAALGTEGGSGWQLDETESGEWGQRERERAQRQCPYV